MAGEDEDLDFPSVKAWTEEDGGSLGLLGAASAGKRIRHSLVATESLLEPWDVEDDGGEIKFPGLAAPQTGKKKKVREGSFTGLGIDEVVRKALVKHGYRFPTPIQRQVIPVILSGRDVVAMARTGSGKTCAFLAPLMTLLRKTQASKLTIAGDAESCVRAVVVSPTRELAQQTHKFFKTYGRGTGLKSCLIVGGGSIEKQFAALAQNPDVIILTPGRMLQILDEMSHYSLTTVEIAVFDEADRLFEGTLAGETRALIKAMGGDRQSGSYVSRQTILVSATLPSSLAAFGRAGLRPDPALIRLDVEKTFSPTLATAFYLVKPDYKDAALLFLLRNQILVDDVSQAVIFVATRHHVEYLVMLLERAKLGHRITAVHGHMDQVARQTSVAAFRSKRARVMVVTDVAARGVDIPVLDAVINYDFPSTPKLFVHRAGRVARAGRCGSAISLVTPEEMPYMNDTFLFHGFNITSDREERRTDLPEFLSEKFEEKLKTSFCIGRLPAVPLEDEEEWIRGQLLAGDELSTQKKSVRNATGLYVRTRPRASPLSAAKAKETIGLGIDSLAVHPWLRNSEFQSQAENTHDDAAKLLLDWRPKETQIASGKEMRDKVERRRALESSWIELQANADEASAMDLDNAHFAKGILDAKSATKLPKKSKRSRQEMREQEKAQYYLPLHSASHGTAVREKALEVDDGDRIDDAVMDLMGDDADGLRSKRNGKVWDRKRKRFVGVDALDDRGKRVKKNEAGRRVHLDENAPNRGDLYRKWVKKTRSGGAEAEAALLGKSNGRGRRGADMARSGSKPKVRNELRNADEIRKQRKKKSSVSARVNAKKSRQEEMARGGSGGTPRPSKQRKGQARPKSHRMRR